MKDMGHRNVWRKKRATETELEFRRLQTLSEVLIRPQGYLKKKEESKHEMHFSIHTANHSTVKFSNKINVHSRECEKRHII